MAALVAVSTIEPLWENVPGGGMILAHAAPSFQSISETKEILNLVEAGHRSTNDALVTDFYGWLPSYYVALHTKLHPDRICTTNGAPNIALDVAGFVRFFRENPQGVLVTQSQGRLTSHLKRLSDESLKLDEISLQIEPVGSVLFSGRGMDGNAIVNVSRYKLSDKIQEVSGGGHENSKCAPSCVTDLCRRN